MIQELNDRVKTTSKVCFGTVDCRKGQKRHIRYQDVALMYGHRPKIPEVWYLSPYEFETHWEVCYASFPQSLDDDNPRHQHDNGDDTDDDDSC